MGGRAQKALLKILAESIVDGQGDDEGGYARGDSGDGDSGDDADESLAALGSQISSGYEEFEAHEEQPSAISRQPQRIIAGASGKLAAGRQARCGGRLGRNRRIALPVFFSPCGASRCELHSFPPRRSSDRGGADARDATPRGRPP